MSRKRHHADPIGSALSAFVMVVVLLWLTSRWSR